MDIRIKILQRVKFYLEKQQYLDYFLKKYAQKPDFFFVQIGANDGLHADPINKYVKKYNWKGILIEPQKKYFKLLQENYKDRPQLIFENIAIAEKTGQMDLYKVDGNEQEDWHNLVATLNDSRGDMAKLKKIKKIESESVQAMLFADLVKKYEIKNIDLLQMDTEGYENEIIHSKGFFDIKPKIIRYEHKHLSYADQYGCIELLEENNYKVYSEKFDTTAILM